MALYNYWHWSSWKHPAFGLKPSDHHLASLGLFFSKPNSWLAKCVYPSQSLGTKRLGCHLEVGEMVALPEAEVLAIISASNACSLAESRSQGPCHELALEKVFGSHSPLSCWIKVQTSCQGKNPSSLLTIDVHLWEGIFLSAAALNKRSPEVVIKDQWYVLRSFTIIREIKKFSQIICLGRQKHLDFTLERSLWRSFFFFFQQLSHQTKQWETSGVWRWFSLQCG